MRNNPWFAVYPRNPLYIETDDHINRISYKILLINLFTLRIITRLYPSEKLNAAMVYFTRKRFKNDSTIQSIKIEEVNGQTLIEELS